MSEIDKVVEHTKHGVLSKGITRPLVDGAFTGGGSITREFTLIGDSIIAAVYIRSITGTVDINVLTFVGELDSQSLNIIAFPQLSSVSSEIFLKKAASVLTKVAIQVVFTGDIDLQVSVKPVALGESSTKILGSTVATASQKDITTLPTTLLPASLLDRQGVGISNNSAEGSGQILYVGFTTAETLSTNGWPVGPGGSVNIDLSSGSTLFGRSSSGTIDVRLLEVGG